MKKPSHFVHILVRSNKKEIAFSKLSSAKKIKKNIYNSLPYSLIRGFVAFGFTSFQNKRGPYVCRQIQQDKN